MWRDCNSNSGLREGTASGLEESEPALFWRCGPQLCGWGRACHAPLQTTCPLPFLFIVTYRGSFVFPEWSR